MDALILSAGMGKRLEKLTKNSPKTLLHINGKSMIQQIIEKLSKNNITNIVIILGYKAEAIKKELDNGDKFGVKIDYLINKKYDKTENIYSVKIAEKRLLGKSFILLNSDIIFTNQVLNQLTLDKKDITLVVNLRKELTDEDMKIKLSNKNIVEINKKIASNIADGEYLGILKIKSKETKCFFNSINETLKEKGPNVYYEQALQNLIDSKHTINYLHVDNTECMEIDFNHDLNRAREIFQGREI